MLGGVSQARELKNDIAEHLKFFHVVVGGRGEPQPELRRKRKRKLLVLVLLLLLILFPEWHTRKWNLVGVYKKKLMRQQQQQQQHP